MTTPVVSEFKFKCNITRRLPDPNFSKEHNMQHHMFVMRCKDIPTGIGDDPNARHPNVNKRTYQRVKESLLEVDGSEPGTFHLKNQGIKIVAQSVEPIKGEPDCFRVKIKEGLQGIQDGGHTYHLIDENREDIPDNQFVVVKLTVNLPSEWIPAVSGGLNTAVQVQAMSLDNLAGNFDWIRSLLGEDQNKIAFSENDADTFLDARDLTALLTMFNVSLYPNIGKTQPTEAYTSKARTLTLYEKNQEKYEQMSGIVRQILTLHDTISHSANRHLKTAGFKQIGKMSMIDMKRKGQHDFPFINQQGEQRLLKPALYPIMASFRRFVTADKADNERMSWIVDFQQVLEFWENEAPSLLQIVYNTSADLRHNMNAVGKSGNLWTTLHSTVGMKTYEQGLVKPGQ